MGLIEVTIPRWKKNTIFPRTNWGHLMFSSKNVIFNQRIQKIIPEMVIASWKTHLYLARRLETKFTYQRCAPSKSPMKSSEQNVKKRFTFLPSLHRIMCLRRCWARWALCISKGMFSESYQSWGLWGNLILASPCGFCRKLRHHTMIQSGQKPRGLAFTPPCTWLRPTWTQRIIFGWQKIGDVPGKTQSFYELAMPIPL